MKKQILLVSALVLTAGVSKAQLKVGDNPGNLHASAILEAESSTKGFLMPRMTSVQRIAIENPADGLQVYDTITKSIWYWDNTRWVEMKTPVTPAGAITSVNYGAASIYPSAYTEGKPYIGVMTIPYTGGNGSTYGTGTLINSTGVTGLTAMLQPGTLNNGNGNLVYTVIGIPSAASPNKASFALPNLMGATGGNAVVGQVNGTSLAVGQTVSTRITVNAVDMFGGSASNLHMSGRNLSNTETVDERSDYQVAADSLKSKFITINGLRLCFLENESNYGLRPVFYNTTGNPITYNCASISTNNSNTSGAAITIAPYAYSWKIDGDDNFWVSESEFTEYANCMLTFPNGEWYNITFHATQDALNIYTYTTAQRLN